MPRQSARVSQLFTCIFVCLLAASVALLRTSYSICNHHSYHSLLIVVCTIHDPKKSVSFCISLLFLEPCLLFVLWLVDHLSSVFNPIFWLGFHLSPPLLPRLLVKMLLLHWIPTLYSYPVLLDIGKLLYSCYKGTSFLGFKQIRLKPSDC